MASFPKPIHDLIAAFRALPGVGPKTAERFALFLIRQPAEDVARLAESIIRARGGIQFCGTCFNVTEKNPCFICSDQRRDASILCVVAEPQDLLAIERTGEFPGFYHVLGGVLNPIDGVGPEQLRIKELEFKIQNAKFKIKEIILALDPDMEGEATGLYLKKVLSPLGVRVTRLARGLPMGSDLEYADDVTLSDALRGRREV